MNNDTPLATVEVFKKKLKKYTDLKEHEKVKEYLRKLHKTPITCSMIQETKIDVLIHQLASNRTADYSPVAKHLLKRWHHKKLIRRSSNFKSTQDTSMMIVENKSNDDRRSSKEQSESQISDDNKKRKVLSLAQYLESKRHVLSPSSTLNASQHKLTDTQIEIIKAQFKATTEKLAASAPNLANTLNKTFVEDDKANNNRSSIFVKRVIVESKRTKLDDLWTEDDDDDEDNCTNTQLSLIQVNTVTNSNVQIQ